MNHVPFQGGGPANTALFGGPHPVQVLTSCPRPLNYTAPALLRILQSPATNATRRCPRCPRLPRLACRCAPRHGLRCIANLPAGRAGSGWKVRCKAVREPGLRKKLVDLGYDLVGFHLAEFAAAQRADLRRWEKPIKATGVQPRLRAAREMIMSALHTITAPNVKRIAHTSPQSASGCSPRSPLRQRWRRPTRQTDQTDQQLRPGGSDFLRARSAKHHREQQATW